jgi:hypothetical protein
LITRNGCSSFARTLAWAGLKWALGIGLVGGVLPALRAA